MADKDPLAALRTPLRDLVTWLKSRSIPHAIVGGVAACLQGRARATQDIDAVILLPEESWADFLRDAERHGFAQRPENSLAFAKRSRVLLLSHRSGIDIDISLGALPFEEEMIANAVRVRVQGVSIPLARPEDLIVMKSLAMRPHDISDIESLLDKSPNLDIAYVRRWVRAFAEALDAPEIAEQLNALLNIRRKPHPPKKKGKKRT